MFSVAALWVCACTLGAGEPVLVAGGASDYAIVLRDGATVSEQRAATELRDAIAAATGATLPIAAESAKPAGPMILLGQCAAAKALGVDPAPETLGAQGYCLRTAGPNLVIAGTPDAGTLYGVYDFLETCLGVRWLAPEQTVAPKFETLPLPNLDKTFKPPFLVRDTSYECPGGGGDFRAHLRENAGRDNADGCFGTRYLHDGRCHSYFRYISPGDFFDTHPEYFSELGGIRRKEETQLCLTNPDVLDIVTERILKRMEEAPEYQQYNFSQMDYYRYCECDQCRAINEQYGSPGATQFWFVNQLAERTAKVHPDKFIGTLAYMYTEAPPQDMRMHPNVAVWLCHMYPCCDSHPIRTCPRNAAYKERAEAWSKICDHLYIWHYIVDFAHYYNPFPNFAAMADDVRFYRDINVEGIYLQGMGAGGGGGEWSLLRPYYGMKLLWNPDLDPGAVMQDFLDGYYGAAAKPLREYITLLQDKVADDNIHMHLYTNPAIGYLPDDVMNTAGNLFDQAEKAVENDATLLERVRVARMPLTYARVFPRNGYEIRNDKLWFKKPIASIPEINAFTGRMKQHNFQTIREESGDPAQMQTLCLLFSLPQQAPLLRNDFLEVNAIPLLGGRVLRIADRKTGQCVTANNVTRCLFFPFCGGEEARLDCEFRPHGMFAQFNVEEKSETRLTMYAESQGFGIRRTVELDPAAPLLHIATTVINLGDSPVEALVRSHLELDMGALHDTKVRFTNKKGEPIQPSLDTIIAGMREGQRFRMENAPAGEWVFTGTKGLRLTQRFDADALDYAWLYAYPDDLNELEAELWRQKTTLDAKGSVTWSQTLEVTAL